MGIILEFKRGDEAAVRITRPVEGSLGEIVIFPGVRIERYRAAPDDVPERAGGSGKRAERRRKK
ncbi:MAG TPA: hypothetical protein VNJ31_09620 [Methyloceanibacter sp.]|nr:hypothetical protein [Methyloceanibacter sp.]